ncbi:MAG: hypothetical protein V1846_00780 [Candidatus Komeilibacteria bacterium]
MKTTRNALITGSLIGVFTGKKAPWISTWIKSLAHNPTGTVWIMLTSALTVTG